MPDITGIHHVALSVTDLDRSVTWYRDVLGLVELVRDRGEGVEYVVLAHVGAGLGIGLRRFDDVDGGAAFSHLNPGMDHIAFQVRDRAELEAWEAWLEERSVTFSPIADHPIGEVIVFRDPDDIQLEIWLPKVS
jgi:glyoxylase I family protein